MAGSRRRSTGVYSVSCGPCSLSRCHPPAPHVRAKTSRPLPRGTFQLLAVGLDIGSLVEGAHQALKLGIAGRGIGVTLGAVLVDLPAYVDRPLGCFRLIGVYGPGLALNEEVCLLGRLRAGGSSWRGSSFRRPGEGSGSGRGYAHRGAFAGGASSPGYRGGGRGCAGDTRGLAPASRTRIVGN